MLYKSSLTNMTSLIIVVNKEGSGIVIHKKLRTVREYLGLTSTQIASYIKTNVYLYQKYETGSIEAPIEALILLSVAYGVSIALFLEQEKDVSLILKEPPIQYLHRISAQDRLYVMSRNVCEKCSFFCQKVSYRVLSDILCIYRKRISENLIRTRVKKGIDSSTVADILSIEEEEYEAMEKGEIFPLSMQILILADYYQIDIQTIIEKTYKDSI